MAQRLDLGALRPLSLFSPDVRIQQVTVGAEPTRLNRVGEGRGRAAEVLFVLRRSAKQVLLVRKDVYPQAVFRLPTGGIEAGETPQEAVIREIYEETGYRIEHPGLLGVVDYTMYWPGQESTHFLSYVFMAEVMDKHLPGAITGEIDAYRWVDTGELGHIAARLRQLPQSWGYWGRFRAVSYDFIQCGIIQYNHGIGIGLMAGG